MQYTQRCGQIYLSENINLNPIFSLLFFETRFLIYHYFLNFETLLSCTYHSFGGNRVSESLFGSYFLFYVKKRETFYHFLLLNFVDIIK